MKKLLLIGFLFLLISCSKDNEENNDITAEEYGVIIRGADAPYSYKFFDGISGDVFHQDNVSGDQTLFFAVTDKELQKENVSFELQFETGTSNEMEAYLISRKNDWYLNYENNPDVASVFEMNHTNKGSNTIYGVIPVRMDRHFWVKNSEWSNNE